MAYDTGCNVLIVFVDELEPLGIPPQVSINLPKGRCRMATGYIDGHYLTTQLRVLDETRTRSLVDWHAQLTFVVQRYSYKALRLSSRSLRGRFYICESLKNLGLVVATTQEQLGALLQD
jgi:hypothetical protein